VATGKYKSEWLENVEPGDGGLEGYRHHAPLMAPIAADKRLCCRSKGKTALAFWQTASWHGNRDKRAKARKTIQHGTQRTNQLVPDDAHGRVKPSGLFRAGRALSWLSLYSTEAVLSPTIAKQLA
jgi:hypothetical protein